MTRWPASASAHAGWMAAPWRPHRREVCTSSATIAHAGRPADRAESGAGEKRSPRAPSYSRPFAARRPMCDSSPDSTARWMRSAAAGCSLSVRPALRAASRSCSTRSCHSRMRRACRKSARQRRRNALADSARLLLAHVSPQRQPGEEVRASTAKRRCWASAPRAGRPAARADLGSTAPRRRRSPLRTQPSRSASTTMRASRGSTGRRASRRPSAVRRHGPGATRLAKRTELVQESESVADLAAVGCIEEGEVLDLPEPERGHLQDHRGEVRAQDLRLGESAAGAAKSSSSSRAGCRSPARSGRSVPPRWSADACEIGSIGSRCTLVRRL